MARKVAVYWPGDQRLAPNQSALQGVLAATAEMMEALQKVGCAPYLVAANDDPMQTFIAKPADSIRHLTPIQDPTVAICTHWFYGTHTCDGMAGKENPLLLASNWSGAAPGLVGLLNTGGCLESLGRKHSRIWTSQPKFVEDDLFMARLEQWVFSGQINYRTDELAYSTPISERANNIGREIARRIRLEPILMAMLGDTSMGMINGYFGPRLLSPLGFREQKIDQALLPDYMNRVSGDRVNAAFKFVVAKGVNFHWREPGAEDFGSEDTSLQLKMYLAVLDMLEEFDAPCLGWQYQLGLIPILPPSDFCEGLLNSHCRPEQEGQEPIATSTEADQGNLIPMELMKRIQREKGMDGATIFHDVRWGAEHDGHFLWVLLNSGSCSAYAFNKRTDTLEGVHSYRQPKQYFPNAGGTFAGESLPGNITWARAYDRAGVMWMDVGRGRSVQLPAEVRDQWWNGTTREWPIMAADLGCSQETIMGNYFSNHVALCYDDAFEEMVAVSRELGFKVRIISGSSKVA